MHRSLLTRFVRLAWVALALILFAPLITQGQALLHMQQFERISHDHAAHGHSEHGGHSGSQAVSESAGVDCGYCSLLAQFPPLLPDLFQVQPASPTIPAVLGHASVGYRLPAMFPDAPVRAPPAATLTL